MKLAVAVAAASAPSSAFVVWRGFEGSIRKARELGYQGVELALKRADEVNPLLLAKWLAENGLEVSCITTGQVFASLGLYFIHPDPQSRQQLISLFGELIGLAKDFGGMINLGRVRGFIGQGQSRSQAEQLFLNTAEPICEAADKQGVTIVIEPVNRYEINFVNSVAGGAALLEKLAWGNVGLMPDTFHMNIEEARIGESLAAFGKWLKYIHFADSNRRAPGQGHMDFHDVFSGLGNARFDGWAAVEILPLPDPDSAARQAAEYLLPRIEQYNRERDSRSVAGYR